MARKTENFKEMKGEEFKKELTLLRENLRVLRFKAEGSKSKNVKESGTLKKQIARVLTEINSDARSESRSKSVGIKIKK